MHTNRTNRYNDLSPLLFSYVRSAVHPFICLITLRSDTMPRLITISNKSTKQADNLCIYRFRFSLRWWLICYYISHHICIAGDGDEDGKHIGLSVLMKNWETDRNIFKRLVYYRLIPSIHSVAVLARNIQNTQKYK